MFKKFGAGVAGGGKKKETIDPDLPSSRQAANGAAPPEPQSSGAAHQATAPQQRGAAPPSTSAPGGALNSNSTSSSTAPPPGHARQHPTGGAMEGDTPTTTTAAAAAAASASSSAAAAAASQEQPHVVRGGPLPMGMQLQGVSLASALLVRREEASPPALYNEELPQLRDCPAAKREALLEQKLELCCHVFEFDSGETFKKEKEMKRQTLLELVDFVNTSQGQKIFTETAMPSIMRMVRANACRCLPPQTEDYDPEEDEPVLEPSWPHLQVVYEFFLRFVVSSEVNAKVAKKFVDAPFCHKLIELFDSEDPRERDYLKTILHRIYGKFMSHRSFIRKTISNVFYRFVYETERHNGIGELLEILGSIINGFAIPLKREHLHFLQSALIPLHVPKCVALYHQQLSYCVIQFVEKDPDTAVPILKGLIRYWPWSSSSKQVLIMNELEEILELLGHEPLLLVRDALFDLIKKCLSSDHFQVTERTLFLWNNDQHINHGCLSKAHAPALLPVIYTVLVDKSEKHWNATVEALATNVLKVYQDFDIKTFNACKEKAEELEAERRATEARRQAEWEQVYAIAAAKQRENQQREQQLQLKQQQQPGPADEAATSSSSSNPAQQHSSSATLDAEARAAAPGHNAGTASSNTPRDAAATATTRGAAPDTSPPPPGGGAAMLLSDDSAAIGGPPAAESADSLHRHHPSASGY